MSFWTMAFLGSTPIGGPIIGWVGEKIGARWALGVGGFASIIAAVYGTFVFLKGITKKQSIPLDVKTRDKENEASENTRI